ncbi:MAG: CHAT domain-containing protein, partial [Deltaproteobacteria bacterium]|nr:CHAT domain-containing protein [Deltaproteobacteria bacterium]
PNGSRLFFLDKEVTDDTDHLLALGNPERKGGGANLVFAEKEVASIAGRFSRPEVRIGAEATESALKQSDLLGRGVLHIAAHGRYDRKEPLKSALLLAPDGEDDGDLEMVEVFSLRMNPRLVVLSACESGIGTLDGGDEVQGMNRAFLYAGAGGVLASLWSVSDESTYLLMERFYRALEERPATEALRAAQLQVMETFPAPFHWGAFYLTGGALRR